MCNIGMMSYESIKKYISFREQQIIKHETVVPNAEFKAIEQRLEELRRDDYISPLKHAVLSSQIRSMRRWNKAK